MKALLKNYHQAPRKVRLVADLIRGKSVPAARVALTHLPKKSAPVIAKLLDSAVANARQANFAAEQLFIKTITVDKGVVMKRYRPFARGRSGSLQKQLSIVRLELSPLQQQVAPKARKSSVVPAVKDSAKKAPVKKTVKKEKATK